MSSTEGMQILRYFRVGADEDSLASACFYYDSRLWIGNPAVIKAINTSECIVACHYMRSRREYSFLVSHFSCGSSRRKVPVTGVSGGLLLTFFKINQYEFCNGLQRLEDTFAAHGTGFKIRDTHQIQLPAHFLNGNDIGEITLIVLNYIR